MIGTVNIQMSTAIFFVCTFVMRAIIDFTKILNIVILS